MPTFPAATTALVMIDLQNGIVAMPLAPRSGPQVVEAGRRLARRFREAGAPVILVNVAFAADMGDATRQPVDRPMQRPPGGLPSDWSTLVEGLAEPGDIRVTKHQWGAFYATDLDVQLRRRGIRTVVIGGIATNMGVESTARAGFDRGYAMVFAEDAMTSMSAEMHGFSVQNIFPIMGRVRTAAEIAEALRA